MSQQESIRAGLRVLVEPGSTVELRVPKAGRARVISGYFDNLDAMAEVAGKLDGRHPGIYFTCNPVNPALLARASNRAVEHAELTTADHDVARRRWLPVDLDPTRPAGVSATDREHEAAIQRAHQVRAFLHEQGWPEPVLADSGNGAYVLACIDLASDEESRELVRRCLEALAFRFDDSAVHVDQTMFNAARIIRVPGTINRKGDSTGERPHRAARILHVPDALEVVPVARLQALAATLPEPEQAGGGRRVEQADSFDLEAFVARHLDVHHESAWGSGGYRWILRACPFNSDHSSLEAFVARRASGAIAAGCQHHSCAWGWRELRERFDPEAGRQRHQANASGVRSRPAPDAADAADDDSPASKPSQATLLVQLAEAARVELFHTPAHEPYARILVGGHRETWPIGSKPFRRFLARLFYQRFTRAAGSQAIQDALGVLVGKALFEGPERPVFVRVAGHEGAIWLDLADSAWRAVKITATGWEVVASPPVAFRRPAGMAALPAPEPGGTLEDLRDFLNVSDESWPLVVGHLVAMVRPSGPYPVLNLLGGQGSAKTTTARALRDLVDPSAVGLRSEPRDMRDLAITAANNQVAGFDNLSSIPTWLSDGLCRLATGGGFATRELYSDDTEALFAFQRPVILTGIEELAVRGDLLDRSILVYLPAIGEAARQSEEAFWAAYQAARPRLLGALLDAVSTALRRLPEVRLDRLPRMADFALWVTAAAPSLGFDADSFRTAYEGNRSDASRLAVEASPVAQETRAFIVAVKRWEGTATHLLAALNERLPEEARRVRAWPKAANTLTNRLRRDQAALAAVGVRVAFDRRSDATRERIVLLEWVGESSSEPSRPSGDAADQRKRSDDGADDGRSAQDDGRSQQGGAVQQEMAVEQGERAPVDGLDGSDDESAASSSRPSPAGNGTAAHTRTRPFEWVFSDAPVGSCVDCGGPCHTRGPGGAPQHPMCEARTQSGGDR